MSRMKPMSSIRSASSRTRISTARQVDRPLPDVVEQAARRRDDDLGAAAQGTDLGIEADAAVDGGRADRSRRAVGADALLDLEGELAGRREDEGADAAPTVAAALAWSRWIIGSTNAAVLPVPVWAPAMQVAAGEDQRDGFGLDGGGHGVALFGDRAEELGRQPETIEGHGVRRS